MWSRHQTNKGFYFLKENKNPACRPSQVESVGPVTLEGSPGPAVLAGVFGIRTQGRLSRRSPTDGRTFSAEFRVLFITASPPGPPGPEAAEEPRPSHQRHTRLLSGVPKVLGITKTSLCSAEVSVQDPSDGGAMNVDLSGGATEAWRLLWGLCELLEEPSLCSWGDEPDLSFDKPVVLTEEGHAGLGWFPPLIIKTFT